MLKPTSITGPNSSSSSLSASSSTKYFKARKLKPLVRSRWSNIRPGVATTTCGFFARAICWGVKSMPPTIVVTRRDIIAPRASNVLPIWKASSRVGARTRENKGWGLSSRACRMGSAKAAVFPEPVSARPTMSLPWSATGIDSAWIWVGRSYFNDAHASAKVSTTPYILLEAVIRSTGNTSAYQVPECLLHLRVRVRSLFLGLFIAQIACIVRG